MSATEIVRGLTLAVVSDWATTLGLIFGGCCSNALALEDLTRAHPRAGSLITFAQFVLISAHGLPTFLVLRRPRQWCIPRLRARRTPLAPYLAQVALFYAISLLNNAAFAYGIPMAVQIVFRSGGLVVSMLMGWLVAGKRYNTTQVLSVVVVTAGVVLTTLSAASAPKSSTAPSPSSSPPHDGHASRNASSTEEGAEAFAGLLREQWRYATGIALLTLALVLSGMLGIAQDWTYARYVRTQPPAKVSNGVAHANGTENGTGNGHTPARLTEKRTPSPAQNGAAIAGDGAEDAVEPWQESMFYLHFLSLPMFYFVRHDLAAQARALRASPPLRLPLPALPASVRDALTLYPSFGLSRPFSGTQGGLAPEWAEWGAQVQVPRAYAALALTAGTALVCAAGVHRLTARGVSALAVTLLLVVRKAASLVLSVVLFPPRDGPGVGAGVWVGAAMVFAGTMGYAAGSRR
ncbi:UAA transporter family-domain-containing protein, partial [Trametes polyzona]